MALAARSIRRSARSSFGFSKLCSVENLEQRIPASAWTRAHLDKGWTGAVDGLGLGRAGMDGCGGGPVKGVPVDSHEHVCVRQERVGELEALHVFEPRFRHGSNPELVQHGNTENRCVKLTLVGSNEALIPG